MDLEQIREHCLAKPGVTEDFPFDEDTLAFRVMGKIFLLTNLERHPSAMNLKCDPERAIELREEHAAVEPGYHMSKKHWNTVTLDGTVAGTVLLEWVDHSYELVAKGLKKSERDALARMKSSTQDLKATCGS